MGLHKHLRFINQYLQLPELLELLQMSDIDLFTSKDRNQAVSGTFAYAVSCGCPIISTAIFHVKEILSFDTGKLVDFQNPGQISHGLLRLSGDKILMDYMSKNASDKSLASEWKNVSANHAFMFQKYLTEQPLDLKFIKISHKPVYTLAN